MLRRRRTWCWSMSRHDDDLMILGGSADEIPIFPDAILEDHTLEIRSADLAVHHITILHFGSLRPAPGDHHIVQLASLTLRGVGDDRILEDAALQAALAHDDTVVQLGSFDSPGAHELGRPSIRAL